MTGAARAACRGKSGLDRWRGDLPAIRLSPLSTDLQSLTLCGIVIAVQVNAFDGETAWRNRKIYSIWCLSVMTMPYIAVNGIELPWSRRFGRDSFQTRSTS